VDADENQVQPFVMEWAQPNVEMKGPYAYIVSVGCAYMTS
jgi:hypothetical protein